MIKAENLVKFYQAGAVSVKALNGVNLEVGKGEFLTVMGPSGSGKSTLLHLLGGIDRPSSGRIQVDGVSLTELGEDALTLFRRERIGFVFQSFNLMPALSVEENVGLPLLIAGGSIRQQRAAAKISSLLSLMGLAHRRHHRPYEISGGEQQRAAIARALVNDPAFVLLDEPTGNLDAKNGRMVLELLARIHREMGATIVMITHNPSAAEYGGRVILMRDGAIADSLPGNGLAGELARRAYQEMLSPDFAACQDSQR